MVQTRKGTLICVKRFENIEFCDETIFYENQNGFVAVAEYKKQREFCNRS